MGISEDREECLPSPPPPQCQRPGQELSIAAEWIFTLEPGDSSPGDLEIPTALEILLALICARQDSATTVPDGDVGPACPA